MNKQRRHLTSSQLAVVGLDVERELAKEAKERQRGGQGGVMLPQLFAEAKPIEAREQAAKLVGTNRQYISDAKKLAAKSPEMLEQVRQGSINLPNAIQHVAAVTSYPELAAPGIPRHADYALQPPPFNATSRRTSRKRTGQGDCFSKLSDEPQGKYTRNTRIR